ncbi:MAG TPA: universal stress protein [Gemmatimonadota bacterium]|nr:universal stress protein [Gemmatimonadota bacterium]
MYGTILVPLELEEGEGAILDHVARLAEMCGSEVILLHVAAGWRGRYFRGRLQDPEEPEFRERLQDRVEHLRERGIDVRGEIRYGTPAEGIVDAAADLGVDLIAMATHGHRGVLDLLLGSAASEVRHQVSIPVLLMRK